MGGLTLSSTGKDGYGADFFWDIKLEVIKLIGNALQEKTFSKIPINSSHLERHQSRESHLQHKTDSSRHRRVHNP